MHDVKKKYYVFTASAFCMCLNVLEMKTTLFINVQ